MFKRAYVEITNRCNLRCTFCPGTRRPLRDMTEDEFIRIISQLKSVTDYLYFHVMGEPLLHPRLAEFLSLTAERGFRVCLTTNGTLLHRQMQTLQQAKGLHKISVSLHSFEGNEGAGDMSRYLSGVWEACLPLAQSGVICALRLWNEGGAESKNREIEAFLESACGIPTEQWPVPRAGVKKLGKNLFLERATIFDWPDLAAQERETEFCHALRQQVAVLCDGTVVPCCLDHEGDLALGNLLTQDLNEILHSERAVALYEGFSRRSPSEELCRKCGYATRFNL